jgi:N-acetylneuraminic acid mutarotase
LLGLVLLGCSQKPELDIALHESAAMPSPRASAACFVVDDKAYVFAGRDSNGTYLNDLWCYDPAKDEWTNAGTSPMRGRVNATACVKDDKVYLGLGFNGRHGQDTSYLKDWWEYVPTTKQWTQLADYPNEYTDKATCFVGEKELYVGYGFCWNYRRDLFRYDIATNRWDSVDVEVSFHGYPTRSFGGTGCTCQKRHFMGTGYFRHSLDWWAEFDGQHWTKRTSVPGRARTLAASAATSQYIYVTAGIHYGGITTDGEVLKDIQRYDPATDRWTYVAVLQKGLLNHNCFAIGKRVYIGLGENEEWKINDKLYWFEE